MKSTFVTAVVVSLVATVGCSQAEANRRRAEAPKEAPPSTPRGAVYTGNLSATSQSELNDRMAPLLSAGAFTRGGSDCGQWQPQPEVTCSQQCGQGDFAGEGDPTWFGLDGGDSSTSYKAFKYCRGEASAQARCQSTLQGATHLIVATFDATARRLGNCIHCAGSTAVVKPTWRTTIPLGAGKQALTLKLVSSRFREGMRCHMTVGDPANPGGRWDADTNATDLEQGFTASHVSGNTPVVVRCDSLVRANAYGCPQNYDNPQRQGSLVVSVVAGP